MLAGAVNIKFMADIMDLQSKMTQAQTSVAGAMGNIEKAVNQAKTALGALGIGLSVGSIVAHVKGIIDAADAMNDLSQRTGIAVKDLAKYELAAAQSGTTMEALAKGIKGVSINLLEHGDALKKAGLSATNADDAMMQLADLFKAMPDGMEKTALAVKMFGKSGMDLIPMLNSGSEGLKEAADKSAKYAATMAALAPQADKFNDNLAELSMLSKIAGMSLMNDMLPALLRISQTMIDAKQNGQGFWETMNAGIWAFENEASKHLPGIFESYATAMPRQIANLKKELSDLQSEKGGLKIDLFGVGPKIDAEIASTIKELAAAEEAYKKYLLTVNGPAGGDKGGSAAKPNMAIADWKAQYKAMMDAIKDTGGLKETESEYDKLIKKLGIDVSNAAAAAEAAQNGYNKSQTEFVALKMGEVWAGLTEQQQEAVSKLFASKIASEQLADATKLIAKADLDAAIARDKFNTSLIDGLDKMQNDILAQQELNDRLGLSKEAIASLDAAKLESQAVTLDLLPSKTLDKTLDEAQYNLYIALAEELRNLARLKRYGAAKEASIDAAKTAADEWKKTSDSINNTLTDALMRGFESGKSFAVNMRDTIVNMFKTMVLQPQVKMIVTGITGALGLTGAASAAEAGATGGGWGSLLAGAGAAGGGLLSANGWFASSMGSLSSAGANLYSKGFETIGSSMMDLGNGLAEYSDAITSAGNYMGYASAIYLASQGKWGAAIGTGIGTYFGGPIGAWIGSKIGGWIDSYFGGETRAGGTYKYNPADGTSFAHGPSGGQIAGDTVTQAINSTVSAINGMLYAVGSQSHIAGFIAGLETSDNNRGGVMAGGTLSGGGSFGQNGSGSVYSGTYYDKSKSFNMTAKEAATAFGLELDQAKIEALQAAVDVPKAIKTMLSEANGAYIDASKLTQDETTALLKNIDTMITNVLSLKDTLTLLPFANLKNLSFDAAAGLIAAAGGLDLLGTNLNTYYDKFYKAEEKRAQSIINVEAAFSASGATIPAILQDLSASAVDTQAEVDAVRQAFRDLVDAQNVTTTSGAATYAALIGVAGAFDQLTPAVTAAAAAVRSAADIASERARLQDQYDTLVMTSAELLDKQRNALDSSNQALFDQVQAAQATKTAAESAAQAQLDAAAATQQLADAAVQAAAQLAATNKTWQDQLDVLTGAQTDRSIALRDAGDETTRALMRQVYAQQDLQNASASAAKTIADAVTAINSNLTAAQTATNTALSNVASAIAAQRTIKEAAVSAAQAQVDAITSVFDALQSNIKDLAPTSASSGNAWLDAAIRSGGTSDQKGLADAMAAARGGLSNNNFSSATDAARANQMLVNKLSTLSGMAGGQISGAQAQLAAAQSAVTALDALLQSAQDQVSALRGTGTLSVTDAISTMQLAVVAELQAIKANQITAAGGLLGGAKTYTMQEAVAALTAAMATGASAGAVVNAANVNYGISAADVAKVATVTGNADVVAAATAAQTIIHSAGGLLGSAQDWTMAQAEAAITNSMSQGYDVATVIKGAWQNWGISEADVRAAGRAAGIPGFDKGTNWVPQDMLARIHQGEAIIPAPFNPAKYGRDSGNDALVTEIKALREEVKSLRETSERGNENTQRAADTLAGRQGVPFLVEIAK